MNANSDLLSFRKMSLELSCFWTILVHWLPLETKSYFNHFNKYLQVVPC